MDDVKAPTKYFRFVPAGGQEGILSTPLMGETRAGRIYVVTNPQTASVLATHPEWVSVSEYDYDTQADNKE